MSSTVETKVSIYDLAKEWLRLDKNPTTRSTIEDLVRRNDESKLESLLREPITFGTAGLRARMEAGFSRMNDLTVIQASQGLAHYVLEQIPDSRNMGVVIGFDHRYNSERFAKLSAAAFLNLGFKVYLYKNIVHTPLVPFGIKTLGASCGVMVTASHNPKLDNGYKVYWSNASQIVEPHDEGIANMIKAHYEPKSWDTTLCEQDANCIDPHAEMWQLYFSKLSTIAQLKNDSNLPHVVYTAMHGVGGLPVYKTLESIQYPSDKLHAVVEQIEPDPEFPTIKFPNPEEKGALDMAVQLADQLGHRIVLANDPDADRFAIAEKVGDKWVTFTGNQLGTLLAEQVWYKQKHVGSKALMLASTVSSKMLKSMAQIENFQFEETLTGFKWMGNRAQQLQADLGLVPLFAYEEAIGYMVGDTVYDKDGVSALATFLDLLARLQTENKSVNDHLMQLYYRYGVFVDSNAYYLCYDPELTRNIFNKIRYAMGPNQFQEGVYNYPTQVAGFEVTRIIDLTVGYDSAQPDFKPLLPTSSSTQMITFYLKKDSEVIAVTLRTSGTEPKIKYYSELNSTPSLQPFLIESTVAEVDTLKLRLRKVVDQLLNQLLEPELNGLKHA